MNNTLKNTVLTAAGITIISAAAVTTNTISSAVGAVGGAVFGSLCVQARDDKKAKKREEAIRVATAFKASYEKNKGVVLAEELSFFSDINLEEASVFLSALAESQNGQKIPLENTVAYVFPHTENVLDTLTRNSQAWVESRTQPLLVENQNLRQQLAFIQAEIRNQMIQQPPAPTWAPQIPEPVEQKSQPAIDPWKNLL